MQREKVEVFEQIRGVGVRSWCGAGGRASWAFIDTIPATERCADLVDALSMIIEPGAPSRFKAPPPMITDV